jgi:hypothetical protein
MDRAPATAGNKYPRQPSRGDALFHVIVLVCAATVVGLTSGLDRWTVTPLVLLGAFSIVSALTDVAAGANKLRVAGVLIGLMEAVVLLGPGPAAVIGAITTTVVWFRTRPRLEMVLSNVATYAWCGLLAGLVFQATVRLGNLSPDTVAYYLVVFVAYVVALVMNVVGVFGYRRYLYGTPLTQSIREFVLPLMSAQLASALLTMGAALVVVKAGSMGIALVALVLRSSST